ncbi:putative chemotaxis phosphatase, CheX [Alkalidesulfovibrio alkalitolerans DSM 16529]|uniref:Putative chemotaxis phosphatase, CheX n=1 Tax=Alkalidesulfovibrio alkalitolerans DSM 16529 TaxID=1121439 RepID=S7TGF3_9BACT|nr:chemotaxis protein CheX [Alkalidesulfovibrio alkalitolerans]EPR35690.1 putative chemotaxis phosphatase, CheX [Alkalidesulfovibrio alkalitolerans DSM 16529]
MKFSYNVEFINPFLNAVVNVLSTMAQIEPRPGKPYINVKGVATGDVTGIIGISGYSRGTISLTLSKGAILAIVNNMLAETYTEINEDIADGVGELTNMISGQARAKLSEQGMSFQASTPSVVVGAGHKVTHLTGSPILAIPFETDHGPFVVEVCLARPTSGREPPQKPPPATATTPPAPQDDAPSKSP